MNYIHSLENDVKRARAESAALRAGLYALRAYAGSDKYAVTEREPMPTMNPADVILRVDEALFAASEAECEVRE